VIIASVSRTRNPGRSGDCTNHPIEWSNDGYVSYNDEGERCVMSLMDPEDQKFGHKAAHDQEKVDELERQGVSEEDLSDEPPRDEPRAGRKADEP
jgi:hypothetical protein